MKYLILGALIMSMQTTSADVPKSVYDFKTQNIDEKPVDLSAYKGQVVLIVNTASECGYTPQYNDLEALYQKYKGKKFAVLGFPSNDFGGQEPGSNAEIKKFCDVNAGKYHITFPMFAKSRVKSDPQNPLYKYLIANSPGDTGPVSWNFEKFLVDKDGKVIGRYKSKVKPMDAEITKKLEEALAK
jgi:glutathione peroxidase